jgi:hypothetical protein
MAGTTTNSATISTTSSPFEPWIDFVKLRAGSIEYLSQLTGDIWTDYNAHDPGITILEMLCYAVMDLGYRASLPIEQILAPAPQAPGATAGAVAPTGPGPVDSNFFTPAQILACNPLTILDYRRLLIDIEGVTNAWLDVADNVYDLCASTPTGAPASQGGCKSYLNGLYHVSLQLDESIKTPAQQTVVVDRVRKSLMAHRNFCEDFVDIGILCSMGIGVCADIEVVVGADAGTVFQGIVGALQAFFSTAPKFYTLQELLQPPKSKPIESIFAGRPYDITQSHGFVDPDEFDQINLRKEIHLSDLYRVILGVSGVATIRRLSLNVCGNNPVSAGTGWTFSVPANYVPVFDLSCCGWQFSQNNRAVQVDIAALSAPFSFNYTANAKLLYPQGSPYLDLAIEYGNYLPGLGDYYSIQNEFPRVYGIGNGGIPSDAPVLRKAQALQLKGYLLFFDQMLADYVAQLQNLRNLFSLSAPPAADRHTYFTSQLSTVPGIANLIGAGQAASSRAIAVGAKLLHELRKIRDGKIADAMLDELSTPYPFETVDERNIAVYQLIDDTAAGSVQTGSFVTEGGCWYFYLTGTAADVILLGRQGFGKQQDAVNAAGLILSSAAQKTNYSLYNLPDGIHFSFSVGVDIPGYYTQLQQLAEDSTLYTQRRGQFLDHLLARFSEQFVDLAILNYGFLKGPALDTAIITAKEGFLTNYIDLSSNRGKGPDYSVNGWYNDNVSGFEKRVAALGGFNDGGNLGGFNDGGNHSLCNFVVEQREDRYIIRIVIDGTVLFLAEEKLYSREATCESARELFRAAADFGSYRASYDEAVSRFGVKLYYQNKEAWCAPRFDTHGEALDYLRDVHALFAATVCEAEVSQRVFRVIVTDHTGAEVAMEQEVYRTEAAARKAMSPAFAGFQDVYVFGEDRVAFVDLEGFRFVPDDAIVDRVGWMTYRLLDKAQRFKLLSTREFNNQESAKEDYYQLIRLLGEKANIAPVYDKRMEGYQLRVMDASGAEVGGERGAEVAVSSTFYPSLTAADAMIDGMCHYAARHLYYLETPERAYRWKFQFRLAFPGYGDFEFRSKKEYESPEEALEAGSGVDGPKAGVGGSKSSSGVNALLDQGKLTGLEQVGGKDVSGFLRFRGEVRRLAATEDLSAFNKFVENESLNRDEKWIYRLVDKDHLHGVWLPDSYTNVDVACAKKKGLFQDQPPYAIIDFCLGGDNIVERIDPVCGTVFYHFQFKLTRCSDPALKSLVLFESVQGYAAAADAQATFDANYMAILRKALDPANYGVDKYISTEEVFINTTGVCVLLKSVVFIPNKTEHALTWYNISQLIDKIVALVKLYPIRLITDAKRDREEFKRRFPCFELPPVVDRDCSCATAPVIHSYYFYVLCDTAGVEVWQSVWPVTDLQAARTDFEFFLLLLRYPGNYLVERDPCTCRWSIFIREVLAESTRRFGSKAEAWGPKGIEKFICVTQTPGAFHLYHHRKTCCDSFYVACPKPLLLHPCHYDSAERRDEALGRLYQSFKDFSTKNLPDLFFPHESNFIYDLDGKALAIFDQMDVERDFAVYCCRLLELVGTILNGVSFERTEEGCVIRNEKRMIVAHAVDPEMGLEEWKRRLQQLAWYFPVVREKGDKGKDKFCIEIRLPCFNNPDDDFADDRGCGCDGWKGGPGFCWVAWKSSCCYETCQKAFTDYFMLLAVLGERRNYRPIDDCPCGDYRIVLHQPEDIVAFNPQCYVTPDMDCAAAARARALINAEGLHTVEHILLRPRTQADCQCDAIGRQCPDQTDCSFTWQPPVIDDPCMVDETVCFVPGTDPYSFIATVALPAWPQRFRSKENRAYIEYMLEREAPAHVVLRVLWLAPHDLCCFEAKYRQWLRWLACKPTCEERYTPCDFERFLFRTHFECLGECTECPPCGPVVKPTECFGAVGEQMNAIGENTLLNQINELYCWQEMICTGYQWVDCGCEGCGCEEEVPPPTGGAAPPVVVEPPPVLELAAPVALAEVALAEVAEIAPVAVVEATPDDRERRRFINARHAAYKNRRDALEQELGENETLENAQRFLAAKTVTVKRFAGLMDIILSDIILSDIILSDKESWREELAVIICSAFLDMVVFKGVEADRSELKAVLDRMRNAGIDMKTALESWGAGIVPFYLSEAEMTGLLSIDQN